ncbi:ADP-ribosylglycohydrolase family protein [Cylindrospermum sp. FACHB-282]|uniref:ADP-ribosylglycohydrolase family protein n=1 Tax=Cylindrospermum sp. FACHB-282 TaxID=2692794 RepID=UPI0016880E74|nr:ADP-ribosylglycohydrolase family protein [Cylindrospermum sp. FACHB-282]MBD2385776.1 ADP-ribosylglycohydrolase family protein [Cylindrospermum sp. FACHB-282]
MRYSLVSRFRGTILGAFLGESLAKVGEKQIPCPCSIGTRVILSTESLIKFGCLDLDDWLKRQQQATLDLQVTDVSSAQIIFATLPVALFYHENKIKLRENLLQAAPIWENDPLVRDATLAVGYALAQSLTEKLDQLHLIPQIISFLGNTSTSIPQQLLIVNTLLNERAGLERAQAELSRQEKLSKVIAIAFYCFLSTLEDFRLAVLRATHNDDSQATGAITGALSGAYNSTVGIPANWQIWLSPTNSSQYQKLSSFYQMVELADALAAVWSGVYNLGKQEGSTTSFDSATISVFAAPRVIRSR